MPYLHWVLTEKLVAPVTEKFPERDRDLRHFSPTRRKGSPLFEPLERYRIDAG
jgi:hypothetical protein